MPSGLDLVTVLAQIVELELAIASGELRVQYADRAVQYRDLAEMFAVLSWLKGKAAELEGEAPPAGASRLVRIMVRDGYGEPTGGSNGGTV